MKRTILFASILAAFAGVTMFGCNSSSSKADESKEINQKQPGGGLRSGDTVILGDWHIAVGGNSLDLTLTNVNENTLYIAHSMTDLAKITTVSATAKPVTDFSDHSILIIRGTAVTGKPLASYALTFVEENSYKFFVRVEGDTVAGSDKSWQLCVNAPLTDKDKVELDLAYPKY